MGQQVKWVWRRLTHFLETECLTFLTQQLQFLGVGHNCFLKAPPFTLPFQVPKLQLMNPLMSSQAGLSNLQTLNQHAITTLPYPSVSFHPWQGVGVTREAKDSHSWSKCAQHTSKESCLPNSQNDNSSPIALGKAQILQRKELVCGTYCSTCEDYKIYSLV